MHLRTDHKGIKNGKKYLLSSAAVAVMALTACNTGGDEGFPSDTIELIVPYSAGGSTDLSMRQLSDIAEQSCDTSFIVNNQTGAAGTVGVSAALNSNPDGYTIAATASDLVIPHQLGTAEISLADAREVLRYALNEQAVFVPADSEYDSLDELFQAAENGTTINVATPGTGSGAHISAVGIAAQYNVSDTFNFLPFDGDAEALQAVAGNQADMTLTSIGTGLPQVEGNLVKALATTTEETSEMMPDTPTAVESGIEWVLYAPQGIVAPADTPDDIIQVLEDCIGEAVQSEDFQEVMETQNLNVSYLPGPEYAEFMENFEADFGEIIEQEGLN